ncbi:tyrosine-type recombinase/integrase [Streptomyces phytophilus]|uniref:tyrosine-type recombinase/integrase n=1 Tax=Streptomyces phytophilus TaxID=722715 RepID=UPI0015F0BBF0|nr:site-specific integrase [Streptomyces phytophilus]
MASIVPRPKKGGEITYQVKWRQDGAWQSENFADENQAAEFKRIVDAHGNKWPPGWVRGRGFVEDPAHPDDVPLVQWATRYADRLTGIDERTRDDYHRDIRLHLARLQHTTVHGAVTPATVCNLTADDVQDWVRLQENGVRDPDEPEEWVTRPASPKSLHNRHGLLFCVMQAAVEHTPPLRPGNPCKGTKLPRLDDGTDEEMTFLERDEYTRVANEITDPGARDLADFLVGTGLRWGEATALQVRDINLAAGTVSVVRAWKRAKKGSEKSFLVGPPKTRRARRVLKLTATQLDTVRRLVAGQGPEAWVFRTRTGRHWRHSNFYHRKWQPAVERAIEKGLTKKPRIHDLRHTHVSWLIAARIPLPAIQRRLGHESITTTVDRYGHLVLGLDDDIAAAVEDAMAPPAPGGNVVPLLPAVSQEA